METDRPQGDYDRAMRFMLMRNIILWWLGGLLVERRSSVSLIRGSIPGQVAAV